jgi:hypothetical protein
MPLSSGVEPQTNLGYGCPLQTATRQATGRPAFSMLRSNLDLIQN